MRTVFRDLPEFGLPFIIPGDPEFDSLVREIQSHPPPVGPSYDGDLNTAAVLLNESGKTVVALAYVHHYTTSGGHTHSGRFANLGSSRQMDVLTGRSKVTRDRFSFILPGSKRLITQDGMFGDNSDVLPPEPDSGGYCGGWGRARGNRGQDIERIDLQLDTVFFDDGLCVGPDEGGLFDSVTADLNRQRAVAAEIVEAIRGGASDGRVFEILQPLARHSRREVAVGGRERHASHLLATFANLAIHQLVQASGPDLLTWFEEQARESSMRLHRPS